jgi:hypothetical protein
MRAMTCLAVLALVGACSNGACGGAWPPCCSETPEVSRDVNYVGTIPASDGGTPTQVKFVVTSGGNARLTFLRDGVEIVESFMTSR